MDKPDRRIEKTKTAIYHALIDLLHKKKYANITIQQIIDRANVGRTTFYQHFADKDALLLSCIESIFESLSTHFDEQMSHKHENRLIPVAEIFAHIRDNNRLINGILLSDSGELIFESFKKYWSIKIEPYLFMHLQKGREPKVPIEILKNYVITTLTELLRWWVKSAGTYTPEQMEQYFFALIPPSMRAALED
jgi:AcrR family transcriptional regulator